MSNAEMLTEIKRRLAKAYAGRLRNVVLYGSLARRQARADSDIDILVLLAGPVRLWADLRTALLALYPLSLRLDRPISPKPVDIQEYESQDCPLYRTARREGITL